MHTSVKIPDMWLVGRCSHYEQQGIDPSEALDMAVWDWLQQGKMEREHQGMKALKEIDLRCSQARIAWQIGKQSKRQQVEFLLGELERIQAVARKAIAEGEAEEKTCTPA